MTEKDEYDYGSGARGALLRKTIINYATLASTPIYTAGPSIFDRPSSVVVYDGNGNRVAETDYTYDQTSVASVSSLTSHDETNYSSSLTSPHGNATSKTRQCFPRQPPVTPTTRARASAR